MQIEGAAAIVTGGASGLGKAAAVILAAAGARVAIFDLNDEAGAATAAEIGGIYINANVADDASVIQALDQAEAAHGPARILVNCAGIAPAIKTVGKEFAPIRWKLSPRQSPSISSAASTWRRNSRRVQRLRTKSIASAASSSTRRRSQPMMAKSVRPPIPRRKAAWSA